MGSRIPGSFSLLLAHHDHLLGEGHDTRERARRAVERSISALSLARSTEVAVERSVAFARGGQAICGILSAALPSVPEDALPSTQSFADAGERLRASVETEIEVASSASESAALARRGASGLEDAARALERILFALAGDRPG